MHPQTQHFHQLWATPELAPKKTGYDEFRWSNRFLYSFKPRTRLRAVYAYDMVGHTSSGYLPVTVEPSEDRKTWLVIVRGTQIAVTPSKREAQMAAEDYVNRPTPAPEAVRAMFTGLGWSVTA